MPTYETLFITSPDLTEEDEQTTVDTMAKVVSDGGGTFAANDRMGRRRLAYPIQKFTDGVYVRFLYDAETAVPKELERRLRLSERVLRSLTVRLETNWATDAKEQAVRDAQARIEAAERERLQQLEAAAAAANAAAEPAKAEAAPDAAATGDTDAADATDGTDGIEEE